MKSLGFKVARRSPATATEERLKRLQTHLDQENNILLQIAKSFRQLDKLAYRLGLLTKTQSFTTLVSWWPLILVCGTRGAGKSSFINHYLGADLQPTGAQPGDDKYTVICFSPEEPARTFPGLALHSEPRFPFYQFGKGVTDSHPNASECMNSYLQLKTCPSAALRGKIFIDAPGFDDSEQRSSVLEVTDHILNLSDLVLIMFDARQTQPATLGDTLEHLVTNAMKRPDASKFLYILNQIDLTAHQDSPEAVFAAWQDTLSEHGVSAGRYYRLYNRQAAPVIENEQLRARLERKCTQDTHAIRTRVDQIEIERAYRIIGVLENLTGSVEGQLIPTIRHAKELWKRRVVWTESVALTVIVTLLFGGSIAAGYWEGLRFSPPWLDSITASSPWLSLLIGVSCVALIYLHFFLRRLVANSVVRAIRHDSSLGDAAEWVAQAFDKNTKAWRSFLLTNPTGWGAFARRRIEKILNDTDRYVQTLNNRYAHPPETQLAPASSASPEPNAANDKGPAEVTPNAAG